MAGASEFCGGGRTRLRVAMQFSDRAEKPHCTPPVQSVLNRVLPAAIIPCLSDVQRSTRCLAERTDMTGSGPPVRDGWYDLVRHVIELTPRDLYLGCYSSVRGWGGALTSAHRVIAAGRRRGVSTLLLGATARAEAAGGMRPDVSHFNVRVGREPLLWRVQSWRTSRQLAGGLRRLPRPRAAFLGLSPFWVIAARQAWPGLPVFYRLPCILYNCLPFTWPRRRPASVWGRLDFAGVERAEHLAFALADLTFVPTEAARREILEFHPAARERVEVRPESCEPRETSPELRTMQRRRLGVPDDAVVFLVAGRCDLNKAFDAAVRALPVVGDGARLVVVGDGPQQPALTQLAEELGVAPRVQFVGPQPDMEPWYAAADCVISTSFYDTFPNTLQEAMCRARPVIVPRHAPPQVYAGFAEVVANEGGGLLYDRSQPEALAAAMRQLANDGDTRRKLSDEARRASEQWFRRGSIIDRVFTYLRQESDAIAARVGAPA